MEIIIIISRFLEIFADKWCIVRDYFWIICRWFLDIWDIFLNYLQCILDYLLSCLRLYLRLFAGDSWLFVGIFEIFCSKNRRLFVGWFGVICKLRAGYQEIICRQFEIIFWIICVLFIKLWDYLKIIWISTPTDLRLLRVFLVNANLIAHQSPVQRSTRSTHSHSASWVRARLIDYASSTATNILGAEVRACFTIHAW